MHGRRDNADDHSLAWAWAAALAVFEAAKATGEFAGIAAGEQAKLDRQVDKSGPRGATSCQSSIGRLR